MLKCRRKIGINMMGYKIMRLKETPLWKKIVKVILILVLIVVVLFGGLIAALAITEYKPAARENLKITGNGNKKINTNVPIKVMTWNVGYCGLGAEEDFFMDGGKETQPSSQARVKRNLKSIQKFIKKENPDTVFLQEVDRNGTRTGHLNEVQSIQDKMKGYDSAFAQNFKVLFIPYPFPPMGKEDSGIVTLSKYDISKATRISLPCPFTGISRMGNLKRCLLVSRTKVEGTDKELVFVNLHLEAYDNGEGKKAQSAMLQDFLQKEYAKGNYVLAGGDFNQVFDSADSSNYPIVKDGVWKPGKLSTEDYTNNWSFMMDSNVPSCRSLDKRYEKGISPVEFQFYMIDGFIVSDNISVESVETQDLQFANSDHNPVELKMTLKD